LLRRHIRRCVYRRVFLCIREQIWCHVRFGLSSPRHVRGRVRRRVDGGRLGLSLLRYRRLIPLRYRRLSPLRYRLQSVRHLNRRLRKGVEKVVRLRLRYGRRSVRQRVQEGVRLNLRRHHRRLHRHLRESVEKVIRLRL